MIFLELFWMVNIFCCWQFWQFLQFGILFTMTMIIRETCGLWDIDYNYENWEPEFMTIFVTWQLRVTLDSIRILATFFLMPSTDLKNSKFTLDLEQDLEYQYSTPETWFHNRIKYEPWTRHVLQGPPNYMLNQQVQNISVPL